MKQNEKFDCVKMTREIREKLYKENEGKTLKELAYTLAKDAQKSASISVYRANTVSGRLILPLLIKNH